jgi:DNA primase
MKSDLTEINQLPIVEVASRLGIRVLRGNKAMCFGGHDKLTPSLSFQRTKNFWKCFGCERGGNAINLVMDVLNCDFKGSLSWFQKNFALPLRKSTRHRYGRQKKPTKQVLEHPASLMELSRVVHEVSPDPELYSWFMGKCGPASQPAGLEYLGNHGISVDVANRFGLRELRIPSRALSSLVRKWGTARVYRSGIAVGDERSLKALMWRSYALLFPFYVKGVLSFIQGRQFQGAPKYLNPRGIPKPLFNADRIGSLRPGSLVCICEGASNALSLETRGVPAVGVLGASSFKVAWVEQFLTLDVVVAPDGDRAGKCFARTITQLFKARGRILRKFRVPDGMDIATFLGTEGKVDCPLSRMN